MNSSKNNLVYLETGSTDPTYNLSFEQYILENRTDGDYLLLWQNENTIVIGQNQNAIEEIDREFVEAHRIRVVRRMTGGGAVYHDLGNLNYSFITDAGNAEKHTKKRFTEPVVQALKELGLNAEASGRNDILVDGKKISGTAERIYHNRILHHGTLLFDSDPEMIAGALKPDPAKFTSKSVKSVHSRIGNIRPALKAAGISMSMEEFRQYLRQWFGVSGFQDEAPAYGEEDRGSVFELTKKELEAVRKLQQEKYRSDAWTYGHSPKYTYRNRQRFPGGTVELQAEVADGFIQDIRFFGDFLGQTSLEPFEQALCGVSFQKAAVSEMMDLFPLDRLFGSVTKKELLSLF